MVSLCQALILVFGTTVHPSGYCRLYRESLYDLNAVAAAAGWQSTGMAHPRTRKTATSSGMVAGGILYCFVDSNLVVIISYPRIPQHPHVLMQPFNLKPI